MKWTVVPLVIVSCCSLIATTGCPDRSMLRPVPDYSKQKDPDDGEETSEDRMAAEQAESGNLDSTPMPPGGNAEQAEADDGIE